MEFGNEIDSLVHLWMDGALNRRELVRLVARHTGSIAKATATLAAMGVFAAPERARAQCPATVPEGAPDIETQNVEFPGEGGTVFAYLARPLGPAPPARTRARGTAPQPGILVIHENQGLTDHIKDVTRRVARAGYVALGIDLLSRLGGTGQFPDAVSRTSAYNRAGGAAAFLSDMLSGVAYLKKLPIVRSDRLGVVGFCAGGGNCWNLAVTSPDILAPVVFYGTPPPPVDALDKLSAVLCFYAELDRNLTARMPAIISALVDKRKPFGFHIYQGANHAFHNDTGPNYNPTAACDAWTKTIAFFDLRLRG